MIRIIGIVGSPRVDSNTEKLVMEALKVAAEEGCSNRAHKVS